VRVCYEAGPSGYDLFRQLTALDVPCQVMAPALTPRKPGDRIKTDRRDAAKLVRLFRAGELTPITIPNQPSTPGTSPRAAPYSTGTTVDTTDAIGAATPRLETE
jgi:hypothetical protein